MDIKEYFKKCKSKIEADFQKELDGIAKEKEPEEILAAYDDVIEEYNGE